MNTNALTSYLHTATLCTVDLAAIKHFYVTGMKMTLDGPIALEEKAEERLKNLWGVPDELSFDYYHLYRKEVPSLIQIRLLVLSEPTPHIHSSYSSRELGSFSLGFPNGDQKNLDRHLSSLGVMAMAPMQEGEIPRPDGSTYRYWETIYKGPDYLHCVGIERGDGASQLAPIDAANNFGGPGYSAFVTNQSDKEIAFYTDVLGMELRSDREWETAEGSALGIPAGVPFRFAIVYAKETHQNHLLFLDYRDGVFEDAGIPPRIPNQGLGMWTFETQDIGEILARAHAKQIKVYRTPRKVNDPIYGSAIALTLLTPSGYLIEIFNKT